MDNNNYNPLLKTYQDMFEAFDCIHFNSSVTESVYKEHFEASKSIVLPVTHSDIKDHRIYRAYRSDTLHLIFIGSTSTYKGFPMLLTVLEELKDEGYLNWNLDIWGSNGVSDLENIKFRGSFSSDKLADVFRSDGILVVPSIWNETFSLTTLEALSFGTPVLVSSRVGAKDIVREYDDSFIFGERDELKYILKELLRDKQKLRSFNNKIMELRWTHSMEEHSKEIINIYKSIK